MPKVSFSPLKCYIPKDIDEGFSEHVNVQIEKINSLSYDYSSSDWSEKINGEMTKKEYQAY